MQGCSKSKSKNLRTVDTGGTKAPTHDLNVKWRIPPSTTGEAVGKKEEVERKTIIKACNAEKIELARKDNHVIVKIGDTNGVASYANNAAFRQLATSLHGSVLFYDCDRKMHEVPLFAVSSLPTFFGIKRGSTGHDFRGLHPHSDGFKLEGTDMKELKRMIDALLSGVESPEMRALTTATPVRLTATAKVVPCTYNHFNQGRPVIVRLTPEFAREFETLATDVRIKDKALFCEGSAQSIERLGVYTLYLPLADATTVLHVAKVVQRCVKSAITVTNEAQLFRWAFTDIISPDSNSDIKVKPGPDMQLYYKGGQPFYRPIVKTTAAPPPPISR